MYVSKECIYEAINHFRTRSYKKPEQVGLFFYFKAKGLNEFLYTTYGKWRDMQPDERQENLRFLYDLAAVFDAEQETGYKRSALFPFSISKEIKSSAFYNGATPFSGLISRISDTLDNALVSTFISKNTAKANEIKLQREYTDLLFDKYLLGVKISLELCTVWCLKFWNIEMPKNTNNLDFRDVCILAFLERYHISKKEYEKLFFFGNTKIEYSNAKITGDELRKAIEFNADVYPEIKNEELITLACKSASIGIDQVEKYLSQRKGEVLTSERIIQILQERDAIIEAQYDENVDERTIPETLIEVDDTPEYDLDSLGRMLRKKYQNSLDKVTTLNMFGIKFASIFIEKKILASEVVQASKLSDEQYAEEIQRGINIYKSILNNEYGIRIGNENKDKTVIFTRQPRIQKEYPLNFILYGSPGTGKTYATAQYALSIIEDKNLENLMAEPRMQIMERYKKLLSEGKIVFTTFHQNYGYEEFIQGLRPDKDSETMAFKTIDGVFKKISDKALADTEGGNYVIIIDEINRANISKVFGELITLIEDDKRWGEINETCATLQSGDIFAVPNNLYIIGTMNSADKSISLIDAALRRRFDFFELKPDSRLIKDSMLKSIINNINLLLVDELGSTDLLVGHSYFMNKSKNDLSNILNNNIIPLLYEYFYDNRKKVASILKMVLEKTGAEIVLVDEKIGRLRVKDVDK